MAIMNWTFVDEEFEDLEHCLPKWAIVALKLHNNPTITRADIARKFGSSRANITYMVNNAIKKGMVQKVGKRLLLTDAGFEYLYDIERALINAKINKG